MDTNMFAATLYTYGSNLEAQNAISINFRIKRLFKNWPIHLLYCYSCPIYQYRSKPSLFNMEISVDYVFRS